MNTEVKKRIATLVDDHRARLKTNATRRYVAPFSEDSDFWMPLYALTNELGGVYTDGGLTFKMVNSDDRVHSSLHVKLEEADDSTFEFAWCW